MTDLQVKARANELKEEELATRARELEETKRANLVKEAETHRANVAKEGLTEAADRAKYGTSTYIDPSWSSEDMSENPQTWFNIIKEGFQAVANPFFQIFGSMMKGK